MEHRAVLTGWMRCRTCGHLHTAAGKAACKAPCCASGMVAVEVRHCGECNGTGEYRDQIDDDRPWANHRCPTCKAKGVLVVKPE